MQQDSHSSIVSLKNFGKLLVLLMTVLFYTLLVTPTHAQVGIPSGGVDLDGYAWSSNIGWISMNCRTGGATGNNICGTSNYKVSLTSAGALTGYAWSSNIGWVRFDGLSSFPAYPGTTAASAQVTGTYPNLTTRGWARACAGTVPGDCSSMASRTDGWDGWISLGNTGTTTHSIQFSSAGASATSYAWASNVMGWINFDDVRFLMPTATLSGTNCTIPAGASTCNSSFSWNIQNATSPNLRNSTRSVTYASVAAGTTTPYAVSQGANTIQARDNTTVLQSIVVNGTCAPGTDFSNGSTCEVTVAPAPVITLTTNKSIARSGDTVQVAWTITPSPLASGTCTLSGPGLSASVTSSGSQLSGTLSSKTRFTMVCTGAYGTVRANANVEIIPRASEV
ncbi:hypothetical protein K2P47_03880 [Patescibacteria group bacterium]|nr:hypothetical protein [Patescibacteria group bacterium]